MKKKHFIIFSILLFLLSGCARIEAQDISPVLETQDLSGLYLRDSTFDGILIKRLESGDYIFRRIVYIDNEIIELEWQGAYVSKHSYPIFEFYWHTGRFDDIPGSNAIIVYKMKYENNKLTGIYYFPENIKNPETTITYTKLDM